MKKVDTSVGELVSMIHRGELRLPEMQRRYVWRAPRVRDLLDSLYRGYPSGSILVWETDKPQPSRDLAISQEESPFAGHKLLLDGQQRLTSLSAVLRGETVRVRGRQKPIDILFNLDHPEGLTEFSEVTSDEDSPVADEEELYDDDEEVGVQERLRRATFVVGSKSLSQQANWASVSNVFATDSDSDLLRRAGVNSFDDPRFAKYSQRLQRLRRIRDYPYVMHVLERDLSYEEVAEIFVRVNSLGVKLRGSDLALAQITARWPNSLKLLEDFQQECERSWFSIDLGLLVRAMVVFATGQSRFQSVGNVSVSRLQEGWEEAKAGLRFAVNFLRTNADLEDESLLSSPLFILLIAYYSHVCRGTLSAEAERDLLYWLYVANARGRYSRGSTETLLDADLGVVKKSGGPAELIEVVRQQFGRLDFQAEDLAGRGVNSPIFSLVFLALKAQGAKDWYSGLGISLSHQGKLHYIQYHHIFPKSLLKSQYDRQEINEIANMAFISGNTNRRIGNKLPSEYFPAILKSRGEGAFAAQAVPVTPAVGGLERYREFLALRRLKLAGAINQFLNEARTRGRVAAVA